MGLWIWYAPGTEAQIEQACMDAADEIERRGCSVQEAFAAAMEAAEFAEDLPGDSPTPCGDMLVA